MEQIQLVLHASILYQAVVRFSNWVSAQWKNSRIIHWFLHPAYSRNISEHSIFYTLWTILLGGLRWVYQKFSLEKVFHDSIFCKTWLWCILPVVIAPVLCVLSPSLLTLILCMVGYAALLLALVRDRRRRLKWSPMNSLLLLYGAVYLVGTFFSVSRQESLEPGLLIVAFTLYFLVLYNAITEKKQLLTLIDLILFAAAVISVYGIIQYVFKIGYQSEAWVDSDMFSSISYRSYSTMLNPNMLGQYLILVIPLGGARLIAAKDRKSRFGWFCCCGLMCVCMILTMSRGAWLGLLFAGALFLLFLNPRLVLLLPVALVVLYFVLPSTITSRFTSIGDLTDNSSSYRLSIWMGTLAMLKDYWLCGIGPGTGAFNLVYPAYSYDAASAQHTHNLFLQLLCEGGITILLLFLLILFAFYRMLCARISSEKSSEIRVLQIATVCGVSGFMVQAMTDYSFYNYRLMLFFWCYLAVGALLAGWDHLTGEDVRT